MDAKHILCYGDSNTWGCIGNWIETTVPTKRYDEQTRWPCVLQADLGENFRIVEEGLGGRSTIYTREGEEWKSGEMYLKPCLHSHRPLDLVIIMLGTNDAKRRFNLTPMTIGEGMMQLIRITRLYAVDGQGNPPKVLIVAPPPILDTLMRSRHAECFGEQAIAVTKGLAAEYARIAKLLRCDFFDAASWTEVSSIDAVHFTKEGHLGLAEGLTRKLTQILI